MLRPIFISAILLIQLSINSQSVAINNSGNAADSSAILDIQSESKGFLIPRMTTGQRMSIGNPATGLMVYDNEYDKFYCYAGSEWVEILSGYVSFLSDTDQDTKIQVEEMPDDDVIRFDIEGTETWRMKRQRMEPINPHKAIYLGEGAGGDTTDYRFGNIGIGDSTLAKNLDHYNIAIGYHSMKGSTEGGSNVAIGNSVLMQNVTGNHNVSVGSHALWLNTSGQYNVAMGSNALGRNISGSYNVAMGRGAIGSYNHSGDLNSAFGHYALQNNISGDRNVAIGSYALQESKYRSQQVAVGDSALRESGGVFNGFTQSYNTAIGSAALASVDTGAFNTALGYHAGKNSLGTGNVFLGHKAGRDVFQNNKLYISNSETSSPLIYGDFENEYVGVNGHLAIGLNIPSKPLHVREFGALGEQEILVLLEGISSNRPTLLFSEGGTTASGGMSIEYNGMGAGSTNKLHINALGGLPVATFMSGGNTGIGIETPEVKFQVDGGSDVGSAAGGFIQAGKNSTYNIAFDNNEIMARNNGVPASLTLNAQGGNVILGGLAEGKVGIGTSNPDAKFEVRSGEVRIPSGAAFPTHFNFSDGRNYIRGETRFDDPVEFRSGTDVGLGGGGYQISGSTTGLNIAIDNNEIMARNNGSTATLSLNYDGGNVVIGSGSSGAVGIGTTAPSYKIDVQDSDPDDFVAQIVNTSSNNDGDGLRIKLSSSTNAGSKFIGFYNSSNIQEGSISAIGVNAVSYNTTSDGRLKTNIRPLTGGLDAVRKMKPSLYQWRFDGSHDMGFIAQELQKIVPQAVAGDAEGDPTVQPMGVDYGRITPVLTAAIQELLVELEFLKARVAELEKDN